MNLKLYKLLFHGVRDAEGQHQAACDQELISNTAPSPDSRTVVSSTRKLGNTISASLEESESANAGSQMPRNPASLCPANKRVS